MTANEFGRSLKAVWTVTMQVLPLLFRLYAVNYPRGMCVVLVVFCLSV